MKTEVFFQATLETASMVQHIQNMEASVINSLYNIRRKMPPPPPPQQQLHHHSLVDKSNSEFSNLGQAEDASDRAAEEAKKGEELLLGVEERNTMQYISKLIKGKGHEMGDYLFGVYQPLNSTFVGEALEPFMTNRIELVDSYHPELKRLYSLAVQTFLHGDSSVFRKAETVSSLISSNAPVSSSLSSGPTVDSLVSNNSTSHSSNAPMVSTPTLP